MRLCSFICAAMLYCVLIFSAQAPAQAEDNNVQARQAMLADIVADVLYTSAYINKEAFDHNIMAVMGRVPRHEFVPMNQREFAYENRPLPIGYGQTISQPYIVALMTDLLAPQQEDKVLEIGTGSGYQAAVLSQLVGEVFSIEIIEPLGNQAAQRLKRLENANVTVRIADGYYGWAEHGPYDSIVVTAAASHIPPPLIQQLKPGGRMVIPVGSRFMVQQLVLVNKDVSGKVTTQQILPVRFVPLTGEH